MPWVDERYRTLAGREHRGIAGKSSGGYGAMVTPMLRPDLFGGLATHAGDALFEACYQPEFRDAARALRDDYDGSYEKFWEDFRSRPAFSKDSDCDLLNDLVHGRVLLGRGGRDGAPAVRHGDGRARSRRCGSAGSRGIRCGWCPATRTRSAR